MVRYQPLIILASSSAIATVFAIPIETMAQIVPDNSLRGEKSAITSSQENNVDRIDGGAIRGRNLFHSFQDFNVQSQQKVYFSNPSGIENILGRVTGNKTSHILGTLGVLGNANLYLVNPNGIIFGEGARLDISGSFFASTSKSLILENGYEFSTQNPQSPPLLAVNQPLGLASWLQPSLGTITNSGNLSTGGDLTLSSKNLHLQGQLEAGKNLNLYANENLQIRDSQNNPFIASAGENLLVQGNKIDIFALNHPSSGFFSGKDMVFRSVNSIGANAQFSSGGNFRLEQMDGTEGDLSSTDDPIIRARGDVSFNSYTGASLHIFAGGSVTIDNINITGVDTTNFINETVTLSDGVTQVAINGSAEPTIDIRAGTTNFNPTGIIGDNTGFSSIPNTDSTGTSANININRILNFGGLVFLTNQYQPNASLSGDINVGSIDTPSAIKGGNVFIDSKGGITPNSMIDTSGEDFATGEFIGIGGDIKLIANGNINLPSNSKIFSYGSVGGNITLESKSAIIQEKSPDVSFIESRTDGAGIGGDIFLNAPAIFLSDFVQNNIRGQGQGGKLTITANSLTADQAILTNFSRGGNAGKVTINAENISLNNSDVGSSTTAGNAGDVEINTTSLVATNGGQVLSSTRGFGNGGNITVNADSISLDGTSKDIFSGFSSIVRSNDADDAVVTGNAGTINIQTNSLSITNGAQIRTSTSGGGNAGSIEISAIDSLTIDGISSLDISNFFPSGIFSEVLSGSQGQGRQIKINTGKLAINNGGIISASTLGEGNAGSIEISAIDSLTIDGVSSPDIPNPPASGIFSRVRLGSEDQASQININTGKLDVKNGGIISASTESIGNAGNIFINATKSVSFDGDPGKPFNPSGVRVGSFDEATGKAGSLAITTPSLSLTNGAKLVALTETQKKAGDIDINAKDKIFLSGPGTGLFSSTAVGSMGNAGNIVINSEIAEIRGDAVISVESAGTGKGGEIKIIANRLILDQGFISAETNITNGGDINLVLRDFLLLRREGRISTNAGKNGDGGDGNGGDITINADFVVAILKENSDITANASSGNGGNVDITTTGIFGIQFQERTTGNSDITASSRFGVSGTVSINNPEVDPTSGLVELPENLTDSSARIIASCKAAEANSFIITGRGGLPTDPTAPIRGQTLLPDIRDFTTTGSNNSQDSRTSNSASSIPRKRKLIVEATNWIIDAKGEVELVASLPQEKSPISHPNCTKKLAD